MSTTSSLQDNVNFFFTLLVFVPVNMIVMAGVLGVMAILNAVLRLRFSIITLAIASGLFTLAMVVWWLDDLERGRGWVNLDSGAEGLYAFTGILAGIIVVVVAIFAGIVRLARRARSKGEKPNETAAPPPLPAPPAGRRWVAILIWLAATGGMAITPLLRDAGTAVTEHRQRQELEALAAIIDRDDVAAFEKEAERNYRLWEVKLPGEDKPLIDVLLDLDKVKLAEVLFSWDKGILEYRLAWNVRSPAMADMLIERGMRPEQLISEIAEHEGAATVVKHVVEKHRPVFRKSVDLITMQLLRKGDQDLLAYLTAHGLAADKEAAAKATWYRVSQNDFEGLRKLADAGFAIDATSSQYLYLAVNHGNLPMLQWLLQHPFNINARPDDYTLVEHAIIGNKNDIFDYLLTLKPDVTTLHHTKLDGETNALKLAQRYERADMLAKLEALGGAEGGTQ